MNNSPVCKCAVPKPRDKNCLSCDKAHCGTCGLPLPKEAECICGCHDTEWNSMKKHSPVIHDVKCCDSMNGTLSPNTEVMGKGFDYRDANAGKSPHPDFKDLNGVAPNTEACLEEFNKLVGELMKAVSVQTQLDAILKLKDFIRAEKNKAREDAIQEIHGKILSLIAERQKMNPIPDTPISDVLNLVLKAARGGKV